MVDISHMYITVFVYDIDQKRPPVVHWVYGTQTLHKNHLYKEALNISLIVNSCLNMSFFKVYKDVNDTHWQHKSGEKKIVEYKEMYKLKRNVVKT